MGGEESRKRRQSSGSDNSEEAGRQNPRQRNTGRPDGSGSSSQLPHRPAQQSAQDEEMPDAPSHVAPESSRQGADRERRLRRRRLIVGDGGLSYATALTRKHPGTEKGMYATSFEPEEHKLFEEGSEGKKRKEELEGKGVQVRHGIDATKLKEHVEKGELGTGEFSSIHFNYPRGGTRESQAPLIRDVAASAHSILPEGGKLKISLPSSNTYGRRGKATRTTRNKQYGGTPIKDIKAEGFKFIGKHKDPQGRYKEFGYKHEMTGKTQGLKNLRGHQYVFEKSEKQSSPNQAEYSGVDPNQAEYSGVDTDKAGTESSASEQESENEEMEPQSKSEGKKRAS